jgi:1,4-dihydroxy-2-naphthoyl-CoA hydrolase
MSDETRNESAAGGGNMMGGFDAAMGFEMISATDEEVVIEYEIAAQHRQPYGIVHGGVHCAAVETACSTGAGLYAIHRGQGVVGVENHTSFIRAVRSGRVRVVAKPLTRGRRSQVWEATARDAGGRLIATGRVRLLCLDPGTDLAGQVVTDRRR